MCRCILKGSSSYADIFTWCLCVTHTTTYWCGEVASASSGRVAQCSPGKGDEWRRCCGGSRSSLETCSIVLLR